MSARPFRAPWVEMKYSSTDRPSRKFALIGRGMMSPRGLATRPRIAATCRICIMFPEAPESTIMKIGLVLEKDFSIDFATSLDAWVQISTTSWRRSSSVTRPRSNCFWTLVGLAFVLGQDLGLVAGVTSSIDTVTPDRVAQWNPVSFRASSDAATSTLV